MSKLGCQNGLRAQIKCAAESRVNSWDEQDKAGRKWTPNGLAIGGFLVGQKSSKVVRVRPIKVNQNQPPRVTKAYQSLPLYIS
jgi:hypothetical protein